MTKIDAGEKVYLYNKKELQEELTEYDYEHRFYDPLIGRFTTVDRLAEDPDQIDLTPYAYVGNNPVDKTDPHGDCPSCFVGALLGAAVDYGEQVATNYVAGNKNPWTSNINLTSIGTAAVAGFVTSGESAIVQGVGAKIAVTVTKAVINNAAEYNSSEGLKTHSVTDVVKNTAIDLAADGIAGKIGGKVEKALSKVCVTNAGRLSSTAKKVVNALGQNVTRANTATVKKGLEAATTVAAKTTESGVKVLTNNKKDEVKKRTNTGEN